MPYNPGIQDISGQLLAQGMQARAQGIAGGVTTLFQGLQQNQMMTNNALARFQGALAANPKLLDALNQTASGTQPATQLNPEVLKAWADVKAGKHNVQNTALLAQFGDTFNQAELAQQNLRLRQYQADKLQQSLEQMKKLGDIYATIQKEDTQKPKDQNIQDQQGAQRRFRQIDSGAPESTLQRGTGELSLLNSLKTFGGPALQGGGQSMIGAEPFSYELPPSVTPNPVSAALPTPVKQEPRALGSLTVTGEAVPPPPLPSWFNAESEPQLGMDLNLSPEAKAIARQLREEYEASQPSEGGREPARFLSATSDATPPKRKTITLDAEGIKAILSNPKILVESFADVAGDTYQQGLRRERLDRMMREQEQLRALEQMMRQTRRGR